MLFNSFDFLFIFAPVVLIVFFIVCSTGLNGIAIIWLILASLFYYGLWNPANICLVIGSILFNFALGKTLSNYENIILWKRVINKKALFVFGLTSNLLLLGYYKYANFFIDNVNIISGSSIHIEKIILPLAISFFTFQQITFLVDAYRGQTLKINFLNYCLFITFFPKLIAGPITYPREFFPQIIRRDVYKFNIENIAIGLTFFFIGLFKKVAIADNVSCYVTPVFNASEQNTLITFTAAWVGAIAYALQIYFDFSGYSDMAIGLGRMFGIQLPLNFHSPYKSINIIDFWRRWHITLSRFLRDYIYIPLGGNRKGDIRKNINIIITMLLGGLWHGAGWTFVLWGGLHGICLVINHMFRALRIKLGQDLNKPSLLGRGLSRAITFIIVTIGWVLFRADSFHGAYNIIQAMVGIHGVIVPNSLLGSLNNFYGLGDLFFL